MSLYRRNGESRRRRADDADAAVIAAASRIDRNGELA
jgi:hypothetical protein